MGNDNWKAHARIQTKMHAPLSNVKRKLLICRSCSRVHVDGRTTDEYIEYSQCVVVVVFMVGVHVFGFLSRWYCEKIIAAKCKTYTACDVRVFECTMFHSESLRCEKESRTLVCLTAHSAQIAIQYACQWCFNCNVVFSLFLDGIRFIRRSECATNITRAYISTTKLFDSLPLNELRSSANIRSLVRSIYVSFRRLGYCAF